LLDFKDKTDFIYKAMEDTTNTIRFIDTKVASIFVVLGVLTSLFIFLGERIITVYNYYKFAPIHSTLIGLSVLMYFISSIMSIFFGFKTINIVDNSCDYINNDEHDDKNLWYLLIGCDNRVSISVKEYLKEINRLDEDSLVKSISIEFMKVSAIRNIKMKNIKKSIKWFEFSIISLLIPIFYILFYYSIYRN